jgi:hypothetical protein
MRAGAVVVARGPGRQWGNPWQVARDCEGRTWVHRPDRPGSAIPVAPPGDWREIAVARYRHELLAGELAVTAADVVTELTGRHLYCWCPAGRPCRGDVLLTIANHPTSTSSGRPGASTDERGLW